LFINLRSISAACQGAP